MCDDINKLLEQLKDMYKQSQDLCRKIAELKDLTAKSRENSYDEVTRGLNKIAKCIDAADSKMWDAQMQIESVKVDIQRKIEKDERDLKDKDPDLFPPMQHGVVR